MVRHPHYLEVPWEAQGRRATTEGDLHGELVGSLEDQRPPSSDRQLVRRSAFSHG